MTYLQIVNEVLARLRENSVASVTTTNYSTLIGHFVNDAKRQVEDAWNWEVLGITATVTTTPGTYSYTVTGSGKKQKNVTVNVVGETPLRLVSSSWIQDQQQLTTVGQGIPCYYAWAGNNGTDSLVEVWPTPNAVNSIKFNMTVPQAKLSADGDVLLVSEDIVIAGAFARALVERGEDGALGSSEAVMMFKAMLADNIAIEQTRDADSDVWVAT